MSRPHILLLCACFTMYGCVQTNSMGSYHSISTVRYGANDTLVQTHYDQWQNQQRQTPSWQAHLTPMGSSVQINAAPPPQPVNVIFVPKQAPCHSAPYITQGTLWPAQRPCR